MAAPIKNILFFIGADLLMRPAAGNFQVFMDRKYVRVMFRIRLHVDDVAILYRIKECAYKKYSMGLRPARGRKSSY